MSFASEARGEIAARLPDTETGLRAACYGLACFAKHFDARGLVIQTEQAETAGYARQCFARCGVQGGVLKKDHASGTVYEFKIEEAAEVAQMHALFGTTGRETSLQIDPDLIRTRGSVSAYVGAAFLCCGTVTDPQKGYHLEFTTPRTNLARDFEALLAEHEFAPRRSRRKGVNVIYLKACANIQALLVFMGAEQAAGQMNSERAVKSVRNQVNRYTNCETANLGKTVRANASAIKALRYLQEQNALDTLPEPLRQTAVKRLEYPELSLAALCETMEPRPSKSGLAHRLKRLEALSADLRTRKEGRTS